MPYFVIARIPRHGRDEHNQREEMHVERDAGQGRYRTRHEEKRIAREEGSHHQSRLAKDDQEQDRVHLKMVVLDDLDHVLVDV